MWTKSLIFTYISVNQKLSMYVLHLTVNIFDENREHKLTFFHVLVV